MFSQRNKYTNILMHCKIWNGCVWKYNFVFHNSAVHHENEIPTEAIISDEESFICSIRNSLYLIIMLFVFWQMPIWKIKGNLFWRSFLIIYEDDASVFWILETRRNYCFIRFPNLKLVLDWLLKKLTAIVSCTEDIKGSFV